jgi:proline-specific peptidase
MKLKRFYSILIFTTLLSKSYGQSSDSIVTKIGSLYYKSFGKGEKIILLSGGPGVSSDQLLDIAVKFSDKFNCILFDQRGTGLSKAQPFDSTTINIDTAIADLELLRLKLKVEKLKIIGHSWGAILALAYAVKNPDKIKSLILIGPGVIKGSNLFIIRDNRFSRTSKADEELIKQWSDSIKNNPEKANYEIRKIRVQLSIYDRQKADSIFPRVNLGIFNARMAEIMGRADDKLDLTNDLKKFKKPIYIICGRQDPVGVFPTFDIKGLCPQTKITWIEKSGHFPWLEQQNDFYNAINEYLVMPRVTKSK